VTRSDVTNAAAPLKVTLAQSMSGALQGQGKEGEQLFIPPCTPTVMSDHSLGAEAAQVKVTVSETCSAVEYNSQELDRKATDLLHRQAAIKTGTGYSLFGGVQVSVKQASVTHTTTPPVFLSFKATGMWIYGLSQKSQQRIKNLITGKTRDQALHILAAMPGIERGSISFTGFTDDSRLPKNSSYIHLILLVS
jgi:hypothetical protein